MVHENGMALTTLPALGRCCDSLEPRQEIIVKEASGKVFLQCVTTSQSEVTWLKDRTRVGNTTRLDLGAIYDDPRGIYTCETGGKRSPPLQVHYRTSDRQNLIANEQLYQPLGERDDGQYSRLAPAKARK
ncbi:PREDICTED: T-cell surface glycoprotein CD3 delta chain [Charadrius vociferus]|uniref:T-cell surface glycoprotein CD3 delta chain n=1 Tax=Charadrius vociferus TaxID=50402 RepID=UPI00052165B6|nr:PREDICTED: T-cell surface glycoprotein CD3 delta chain [Charadrius vociferus]